MTQIKFTKTGAIRKKKHAGGRPTKLAEQLESDNFLTRLKRVDPNALDNVIGALYEIAIDKEENIVARVRSCEIILAYGLGKPPTTEHEAGEVKITFTRAVSPVSTNHPPKQLD
jgi:hypothetical protein